MGAGRQGAAARGLPAAGSGLGRARDGPGGPRGWEARGGQVANGEWAREATAAALPTRVAPRGGDEVEAREERQVAATERAGAENDEGGGG